MNVDDAQGLLNNAKVFAPKYWEEKTTEEKVEALASLVETIDSGSAEVYHMLRKMQRHMHHADKVVYDDAAGAQGVSWASGSGAGKGPLNRKP